MAQFWDDLGVRVATTILITPIAVGAWKLCEHMWHRYYSRQLRKGAERYAAANENRVEVALVLSVGERVVESARAHRRGLGKVGGAADIPIEEHCQ